MTSAVPRHWQSRSADCPTVSAAAERLDLSRRPDLEAPGYHSRQRQGGPPERTAVRVTHTGLPTGHRIHIVGNSCAGKSTLGAQLSAALGIPLVELDALNWQPGWVALSDTNPEELERRIGEATRGDGWVVAGSYMQFSQRIFWPRLETIVWLDLPMVPLIWRMLIRSWRRWRSQEPLWGTNYERFWPQLMVWRKEDSLLWWIVTQHRRKQD